MYALLLLDALFPLRELGLGHGLASFGTLASFVEEVIVVLYLAWTDIRGLVDGIRDGRPWIPARSLRLPRLLQSESLA